MELKLAARRLLDMLTADNGMAIFVPAEIIEDGPDQVNEFTQAYDDLATALRE